MKDSSRRPGDDRRPRPPRDRERDRERPPQRRQSFFRAPEAEGVSPVGEPVEATVRRFDPDRGFGFVDLPGGDSAFLHARALELRRLRLPSPGDRLRVRIGEGPKGLQVTEVIELARGEPPAEDARPRAPRAAGPRPERAERAERGPRPAAAPAGTPMLGTVKWYDAGKGFGFVEVGDGGPDVFLHASALERTGMAPPAEGQPVMILVVAGARGREVRSIAPAD